MDEIANKVDIPASSNSEAAGAPPSRNDDGKISNGQGNLFVGSLAAAESSQFIQEHNISHILSIVKHIDVHIPENDNNEMNTAIKQHLVVECLDHPMENILKVLPECLNFIKTALEPSGVGRGNVLVHCASGVSRSVTVCAAYLIVNYSFGAKEAIDWIARTRKYANPNIGFRRQLQILQQQCREREGGGDVIENAMEEFSKQNIDVVEATIEQRKVANDLHSRVDELEGLLTKMKSRGEQNFSELRTSLCLVQSKLDGCLPTDSEGLVDPAARMIRKSATSKLHLLLKSIE